MDNSPRLHVIHDPATGRIVGSYHGPADEVAWQHQHWPGMAFAESDRQALDPKTMMVSGGPGGAPMVVDRPILPGFNKSEITADGVDAARMKHLPPGMKVTIDDQDHVLSDPTLEITATMPATYRVSIDHWPYQAFTATVTAT